MKFFQLGLLLILIIVTVSANAVTVLENKLAEYNRIPTSEGWFEVIKLPNQIYAFYEPGHSERVNSFLILGDKKDLLYDTGMGIASIKQAIKEVRKAEGLPHHEIIVLNSHGHLDHIGGNFEFDKITALDNRWRIEKIMEGIPAGNPIWVDYYSEVSGDPQAPKSFNPETFSVPGISKDKIELIQKDVMIDLGNRQFKLINMKSHTKDSIVLYDPKAKILFTGDTFVPGYFYVLDFNELEMDLKTLSNLDVAYHYNTHGNQLIDLGMRNLTLEAVIKINNGDVRATEQQMFGEKNKVYEIDDMYFFSLPNFLMY
jgi:glyoxylase-like metal-dependent hydrolase (beta-lactamase superfamily II)